MKLSQYLSQKGLLFSEDKAAIAQATREHKKIYQRGMKQMYRKRYKEKTIAFEHANLPLIQEAADNHNLSFNKFVQAATVAYIKSLFIGHDKETVEVLQKEIRKIGNNINQLVKYCHENKMVTITTIQSIQNKLAQLEQEIEKQFNNSLSPNEFLQKLLDTSPEHYQQAVAFIHSQKEKYDNQEHDQQAQ